MDALSSLLILVLLMLIALAFVSAYLWVLWRHVQELNRAVGRLEDAQRPDAHLKP